MSILSKLSRINERNAAVLSDVHELAGLEHELRLRYLVAIALGVAINRDTSVAEVDAFNGFAKALNLDEDEAQEIITERASISEEDLESIFIFLKNQECIHYYLRDLSWMMCVDHEKDDAEIEYLREISTLMNVPIEAVDALYVVMSRVQERTSSSLSYDVLEALNSHPKLYEVALPHLKKIYNVDSLVSDRWLDNGDDTWTDLKTGLMWLGTKSSYFRGYLTRWPSNIFGLWPEGPISDTFNRLMNGLYNWRECKDGNSTEDFEKQRSGWRFPTAEEVASINVRGRLPSDFLESKLSEDAINENVSDALLKDVISVNSVPSCVVIGEVFWAEHINEKGEVSPVDLTYYLSIDDSERNSLIYSSYEFSQLKNSQPDSFIANRGAVFLLCKKIGES